MGLDDHDAVRRDGADVWVSLARSRIRTSLMDPMSDAWYDSQGRDDGVQDYFESGRDGYRSGRRLDPGKQGRADVWINVRSTGRLTVGRVEIASLVGFETRKHWTRCQRADPVTSTDFAVVQQVYHLASAERL